MQQAGYHHANMLASQLQATIDSQGTKMLKMLQWLRGLVTDDNAPNVHDNTVNIRHTEVGPFGVKNVLYKL